MLEDGRNAHVTIRPADWWEDKISQHFGSLHRIKVARSSRVCFKTWSRTPFESMAYRLLRVRYNVVYYANRPVTVLVSKKLYGLVKVPPRTATHSKVNRIVLESRGFGSCIVSRRFEFCHAVWIFFLRNFRLR